MITLYRTGDFIYYNDDTKEEDKFYLHPSQLNFKELSVATNVKLCVNPIYRARIMESEVIADIEDVNGDSYGTTLPELIHGLSNTNIDLTNNAIKIVNYAHSEIHDGGSFVSEHEDTLADEATIVLSFRTSNTTKWAHFTFLARASGEANVQLVENPTITLESGASHPGYNRNRNSAKVTTLSDSSGASWTAGSITLGGTIADGTVIYDEHFGSGKTQGGATSGRNEFILKQNEDYAVVLTSEAAANDCELILDWYEHTNKN